MVGTWGGEWTWAGAERWMRDLGDKDRRRGERDRGLGDGGLGDGIDPRLRNKCSSIPLLSPRRLDHLSCRFYCLPTTGKLPAVNPP